MVELEVLKGIDLEVEKGNVVVIIGPSGSGKTTMLRCLNVLEIPTKGFISIEGSKLWTFPNPFQRKNIASFRRLTGMVFQSYNLFPHKTALENVMEGTDYCQKGIERIGKKEGAGTVGKSGSW